MPTAAPQAATGEFVRTAVRTSGIRSDDHTNVLVLRALVILAEGADWGSPRVSGGVPCGRYLYDHTNRSMRAWLINEHILGATAIGNPNISAIYLDDNWQTYAGAESPSPLGGPTEIGNPLHTPNVSLCMQVSSSPVYAQAGANLGCAHARPVTSGNSVRWRHLRSRLRRGPGRGSDGGMAADDERAPERGDQGRWLVMGVVSPGTACAEGNRELQSVLPLERDQSLCGWSDPNVDGTH